MILIVLKILLALFAVCVITSIGVLVVAAMRIQSEMDDDIDHPWGKY